MRYQSQLQLEQNGLDEKRGGFIKVYEISDIKDDGFQHLPVLMTKRQVGRHTHKMMQGRESIE